MTIASAIRARSPAKTPRRRTPNRRARAVVIVRLVALLAALCAAPLASAQEASSWVQALHSRVRLVSGGAIEGRLLAGIEIELDRGFKTYWRNPGESGLPPRFDWQGSDNAGDVEVRWPAPQRTEDAGGVAFTYADRVLLPVLVAPRSLGEPVRLGLSLDYGVCKEICIPVHAELGLDLSAAAPDKALVKGALKRVPQTRALGTAGPLSILKVEAAGSGKPKIAVTVRRPTGTSPLVFPEAPDNWFVSAPADGEAIDEATSRFLLSIEERPKNTSDPLPLRLTIVAGEHAIETEVSVDLGVPKP